MKSLNLCETQQFLNLHQNVEKMHFSRRMTAGANHLGDFIYDDMVIYHLQFHHKT
jgi:hypothetical protein